MTAVNHPFCVLWERHKAVNSPGARAIGKRGDIAWLRSAIVIFVLWAIASGLIVLRVWSAIPAISPLLG